MSDAGTTFEKISPSDVTVAAVATAIDSGALVGRVVAAGESCSDLLGKRVFVPSALPCGDCDLCRRGALGGCAKLVRLAGTAREVRVPARFVCPLEGVLTATRLPDDEHAAAALLDEATLCYAAFLRAQIVTGDIVLIVGDGVRTAILLAFCALRGARPVVLTGAAEAPTAPATADELLVIDATTTRGDLIQRIRDEESRIPTLKIIDAASTAASQKAAAQFVGPADTLVFVRATAPTATSVFAPLFAHDATYHALSLYHPDLCPEVAALFVRGDLPLERWVTYATPATLAITSQTFQPIGKALLLRW